MAMTKVSDKKKPDPKSVPLGSGLADKAKKAIEENKRKREEMLKETKSNGKSKVTTKKKKAYA